MALNREHTVAEYLTTVTDPKLRKALTMYSLREHSLAIERGLCRHTWLSREDRICAHCPQNEVESELHFLTYCQMYDHIRDTYFPQITQIHKEFQNKSNFDKLQYLLGEMPVCITAARFVVYCHKKKAPVVTPWSKYFVFIFIYLVRPGCGMGLCMWCVCMGIVASGVF